MSRTPVLSRHGARWSALAATVAVVAAVMVPTAVSVPAAADPDDPPPPVAWSWTDPLYWEATMQAGLPTQQYWIGSAEGGGGPITFTVEPTGTTTVPVEDLGLTVSRMGDFTSVQVAGVVGDDVAPGVYQYLVTALGNNLTTASRVLTLTIEPPLVTAQLPSFSGPTDWYVAPGGTVVMEVELTDAEAADVHFAGTLYNSQWPICGPGSYYSVDHTRVAVRCEAVGGPAQTVSLTVDATNDLGTSSQEYRLHVGAFIPPLLSGNAVVSVHPGEYLPPVGTVAMGDPQPTVTVAPAAGTTITLADLGLNLNPVTGDITGLVPVTAPHGSFSFVLTATGAGTAQHTLTIVVGTPPQVSAPATVYAAPGATLGTLEWTWTTVTPAVRGTVEPTRTLAPGLTWTGEGGDAATGSFTLLGASIAADCPPGNYVIPVTTVVSSLGLSSLVLHVVVGDAPVIESSTPAQVNAALGAAITPFMPTATGAPTSFELTQVSGDVLGGLPTGLTFNPATGAITGTASDAAQAGDYGYQLVAHGQFGDSAPHVLAVHVEPAAVVSLDLNLPGGPQANQGGAVTIQVSTTDALGAQVPVPASDLEVSSSVASDVIDVADGSITVTFPHASPHVITVTQVSTGLTVRVEVEVTPAGGVLGATGASGVGTMALVACLALVLGGGALALRRRLG